MSGASRRRDRWDRLRFSGHIAGVGSTSGVRMVVGHWVGSPLGSFTDVMVADRMGRRFLVAPSDEVAAFVSATYTFDEVYVEPVEAEVRPDEWRVVADSLVLHFQVGSSTGLGRLLRLVPRSVATAPAFTMLTDPIARLTQPGVRTRGRTTAGGDERREWYGAHDNRAILALSTGSWKGLDLGTLAPVDPPPDFGFSSSPKTPTVTSVTTTVGVRHDA